MPTLAQTLPEQVALEKISENEFVSVFNPDKMGNTANIAYGGCTLAIGVMAACQTVSDEYHIYSSNGNYLGPAQTDRKLVCKVTRIRNTRTFATRQVEVSQEQQDGTRRPCLIMLADFQVQEPATLLSYSAPPSMKYSDVYTSPSRDEARENLVKEGKVSQQLAEVHAKTFALLSRQFDSRAVPETIMSQNLYGLAKDLPTTQDQLPLTSKTTAEWWRSKAPLKTQAEHAAGLALHIDGALSFVPLSHNHLFLKDAGACSSLDFAVRFFSNNLDISQWHLKELKLCMVVKGEPIVKLESGMRGEIWSHA